MSHSSKLITGRAEFSPCSGLLVLLQLDICVFCLAYLFRLPVLRQDLRKTLWGHELVEIHCACNNVSNND